MVFLEYLRPLVGPMVTVLGVCAAVWGILRLRREGLHGNFTVVYWTAVGYVLAVLGLMAVVVPEVVETALSWLADRPTIASVVIVSFGVVMLFPSLFNIFRKVGA